MAVMRASNPPTSLCPLLLKFSDWPGDPEELGRCGRNEFQRDFQGEQAS